MTTEPFATIADTTRWGGKFDAEVYEQGRLIYLEPQNTPEEAYTLLQQHYPGITFIEDFDEFTERYEAQGYRYPGQYDLQTDYLCLIDQAELRLEPRSRGAGRNAPWGALVTTYYTCTQCSTEYACQSQERQYGVSHEWSYRQGEGLFIDCQSPETIPPRNPYGFTEVRLVAKRAVG